MSYVRGMILLGVALWAALALTGCGTPQVSMPIGTAAVMYANARADYAVAKLIVTQACASGALDASTCQTAKEVDIKAVVYRDAVERALMDPSREIDWAQVMAYSETVVGLLLKLGLTAAK